MPHNACADMFWTLTQVVDHGGSAEEGADLIYAQLEKVIKQVQTVAQQHQCFYHFIEPKVFYVIYVHLSL